MVTHQASNPYTLESHQITFGIFIGYLLVFILLQLLYAFKHHKLPLRPFNRRSYVRFGHIIIKVSGMYQRDVCVACWIMVGCTKLRK